MPETYEKIDSDNLRVIVESKVIISRQTLLDMLANLSKEKQKTQTSIDSIQARISTLDKEI